MAPCSESQKPQSLRCLRTNARSGQSCGLCHTINAVNTISSAASRPDHSQPPGGGGGLCGSRAGERQEGDRAQAQSFPLGSQRDTSAESTQAEALGPTAAGPPHPLHSTSGRSYPRRRGPGDTALGGVHAELSAYSPQEPALLSPVRGPSCAPRPTALPFSHGGPRPSLSTATSPLRSMSWHPPG